MGIRMLVASVGIAALVGCATESKLDTNTSDTEAIKESPAGISVFGFTDVLTTLPGVLGGAYPACVTPTVNGSTATLALAGCRSASGGTLAGTLTLADALSGSTHTYTETFGSLVNTRSSTAQWVYSGSLTATVNGAAGTLTANPGFKITVTDTATPANSKAWTFTCGLSSTTTSTGFSLSGSFAVATAAGDSVSIQIDPASPLTWVKGGAYPVTGKLVIQDNRTSGTATRETVTALFDHGTVTINGGVITLG
ncbi:hypothetical protein [Mesoterricola silvestris]|uniref:Lipoprotein n=1 Tax=Mesoterricola silvestris TaxID=2927979 RepID=A0AA48GQL1_9BACT|nr:hypothetical protein [Mesoterricola silvestris]BDU72197.1 hypothetical protein METEAL_13710 [Mesoterricola silvestris]